MIWFLILFIIVDIIQVSEEAKDDEPVIRRKCKENRVIKLIKEVFWI